LRIRGLNHDDRLPALLFGYDLLLGRGFQVAGRLRLRAQLLHGIHHALRVAQECRAELSGPVDIRGHHVEHIGK